MRFLTKTLSTFALIILPLTASAQTAADPSPRVGRLSYTEGTVSFHTADQTQWSAAPVNYPAAEGASFWTEPQSKAEIEIGSSTLRMDESTEVDILHLDATTTQVQLTQGAINYRIMTLQPGEIREVETPHGAVSLVQPGTYHIDAGSATTPTVVAALEGEARFISANSYLDVGTGEAASANGDPVSYSLAPAQPTPFDDWALSRDKRDEQVETTKYVSPETTGYQDLQQYGAWQQSPQYGPVWIPQAVPTGWAPYQQGHWAWVEPWGWTWIDNQPWGFAPFHYGRWAYVNNNWGWVPGQILVRPIYAPALVAFTGNFGFGGRVGVGVSLNLGGIDLSANIGWLPLAPNEVYYPPYRPSLGYLRGINAGAVNRTTVNNITNNYTTINKTFNNYANQQAATVVPQAAFTGAQPVQQSMLHITPAQFANAPVTTNVSALKPSAYARAAAVAPVSPRGEAGRAAEPKAVPSAPGPSIAAERQESEHIQQVEPKTLSTTGKTNENGEAAQSREAPAATARTEQAPATEPAVTKREEPAAETAPKREAETTARPETREASVAREPGTAPGPAINPNRAAVPIRQRQLAAAQTAKPSAKAQAAVQPRQQVAAAASRQAPVFARADVAKPVQQTPLHATPTGWKREETKEYKPASEHPEDDKKDEKR